MTGWIIFGCTVLFLIWAFTRFVTVTAVYDDDPSMWVKVLFFTIIKLPEDPAKKKRKAEKKAAKEKKRAALEMKKAEKQRAKLGKNNPHYNSALLKMAEEEEKAAHTDAAGGGTETVPSDSGGETKETAGENVKKAEKTKPKKKKGKMPAISVDMIRDYVKSASPPIKRLFKKIRIRDVYIDYVVGSDDAAKTALKYGGLCAAIYSAAEFLCEYMDAKVKEINIEADFTAEKDDIFAYGVVKLRISTALGCVIWLGFRVLKTYLSYNKKTEKPKAGRPRPARASAK